MRTQAQGVLSELVASLEPRFSGRVQGIPLVFAGEVGEVNAFAACENGASFMAITDGLLEVLAWLAQTSAYDRVSGAQKTSEYIRFVTLRRRPKSPLPRPAMGFLPVARNDSALQAHELSLFEEELAFVLGHELAHHYLSHLPCTSVPGALPQLARNMSNSIPVFSMVNEQAADYAGVQNVLTSGKRRAAQRASWTEAGGLLVMRFFQGVGSQNPVEILFDFQRTHPPPAGRIFAIQQIANGWRATGGVGLPILTPGG